MKRRVPKKNISPRIADIQKEGDESRQTSKQSSSDDAIKREAARRFLTESQSESRTFPKKVRDEDSEIETNRGSPPRAAVPLKKFFIAFFVCSLLVIGWFGFRAYEKWNNALKVFSAAGERIEKLTGKTEYGRGPAKPAEGKSFFDGFDFTKIKILLGGAGDVYKNFQNFSAGAFDLANQIDTLQNEWPSFLFGNQGAQLVGHLKKIQSDLMLIRGSNKKLSETNPSLGNFFPGAAGSALSFESDFSRFEHFLDSLLGLLESSDERHILVLFENSSEMRPGGGFLGSYADIALKNGGIREIEVHDINDADRELDAKIVPPKPLQAIVTRWRAADANWFFDYSLSSKKIIQRIEESKKYSRNSITFDGAIAISPKAVSDMLEATGPIQLPGRSIAIDGNNFLIEIQKEVEAGQAQRNAPKKILEELTPILLDKLTKLQENEKKILFRKFGEWLTEKDLMLYFKEPRLENFFDFYGVSGKVFELPKNFNGDYLAVVNANIGGGKTDLFIQQKTFFKTQLNLDGTASDHLTVSREHQGNKSKFWWYRLPNKDYLEIFTAPGAALSSFSGGWERKIFPKINYVKSGYAIDPAVAEIESRMKKDFNFPLVDVFEESGKNVFAAWVKTDSGKTSAVSFDYKIRLFAPPANGQLYQFVFEKQSGAQGEYQFELYAPVGFQWRENKLPVFEYKTDDPSGRIIFNLTFERIL